MKSQHFIFLSMLFLITACSSGTATVMVEPTVSATLVSESVVIETVEPTVETNIEIVVLDFAISSDGKKLAVYLNTGIYLYYYDFRLGQKKSNLRV